MNGETVTPKVMKVAADGLCNQLSAAAVDCAAIIGWSAVFRAVRDAATSPRDSYVAGLAEAAAEVIERHGE